MQCNIRILGISSPHETAISCSNQLAPGVCVRVSHPLHIVLVLSPATTPVTKESRSIRVDVDDDDDEYVSASVADIDIAVERIHPAAVSIKSPRMRQRRLNLDLFRGIRGLHYANGGPVIAELIGNDAQFFVPIGSGKKSLHSTFLICLVKIYNDRQLVKTMLHISVT